MKMKQRWFLLFFFCAAVVYFHCATGHVQNTCAVTIILVGSTGDLAKRYIWPAVFDNNYARLKGSLEECSLVVYGASRNPVTDEDELWSTVSVNIKCSDTDTQCKDNISNLRKVTHFIQLRNEEQYLDLAEMVAKHHVERRVNEIGRIFYLSVPPSAYAGISKYIHVHGRPSNGWLRVVFEKPFGQDLSSAQSLAQELSKYLIEDEIYRIDHYLGKLGVQQIMPFRQYNSKELSTFWNKEFIDRIDIVMKERLDVKGRSGFFNKYGVIRDVLQNHLTEVLFLTAADCNIEGPVETKTGFLSKIYSPRAHHAILGQYFGYQQHLLEDGVLDNLGNFSNVPTYASVALYTRDSNWRGIPFVLTSGKQLEKRAAYVEVVFKEELSIDVDPTEDCDAKIIFLIQDEVLGKPGILLSTHFSGLHLQAPFPGWTEEVVLYRDLQSDCHYTYLHPESPTTSNAYTSLLKAILDGRRDLFVDTESLMESWRIWTPLLDEIELAKPSLKIYAPNSLDILDFQIRNTQLVSTHTSAATPLENSHAIEYSTANSATPLMEMFRLPAYVANQFELASLLAEHIYLAAVKSVEERGSFHIALPGGRSPLLLLQTLTLEYADSFPWGATHVWQTDERCVNLNDSASNFRLLADSLLTSVPIPLHQVHSMLRESDTDSDLCSEENHPVTKYEEQLLLHLPGGQLDYVLLGVGSDGHIASLFPEETISKQHGKLVAKVTLVPNHSVPVSSRISLTYETILSARSISVLISGRGKVEMFRTLRACLQEAALEQHCDLPVANLIRSVGPQQMTLFVDSILLLD